MICINCDIKANLVFPLPVGPIIAFNPGNHSTPENENEFILVMQFKNVKAEKSIIMHVNFNNMNMKISSLLEH